MLNMTLPILLFLLGFRSKSILSFFDLCHHNFEYLTNEKIQAESLIVLCEINYDSKTTDYNNIEQESNEVVVRRIYFNTNNKGKLSQ